MTTPRFDVVVVGGGIVGLATAHAVARTGRSVAVVEREPRLAAHQTGQQLQRHPLRALLRPGRLQGAPRRRRLRRDRRLLPRARPAARGHAASSSSPPSPRSCPGSRSSKRRGDANGVENHELDPAGMREHEPHVRGIAALFVPVDRHHRLPGDRREARRAGAEGRRGDPPRPGGPQRGAPPGRRRGPHGRRRPARHPGRGLRRPALRRAGPRVGRRPRRADHPVPRRVLRASASAPPAW